MENHALRIRFMSFSDRNDRCYCSSKISTIPLRRTESVLFRAIVKSKNTRLSRAPTVPRDGKANIGVDDKKKKKKNNKERSPAGRLGSAVSRRREIRTSRDSLYFRSRARDDRGNAEQRRSPTTDDVTILQRGRSHFSLSLSLPFPGVLDGFSRSPRT